MKRTLSILAVIVLGMTACNKTEVVIERQDSVVYNVSICANYSGAPESKAVAEGEAGKLVSTFRTTDNISVFWGSMQANDEDDHVIILHTDADGKTANINGALSFYQQETGINPGDSERMVAQELLVGQYLRFVYNASGTLSYSFVPQTGTLAGLSNYDFAIADVKITAISGDATGYTLTTEDAHFVNCQSMYKFTFTGLPTGVGVKSVTISSAGNHIEDRFFPNSGGYDNAPITITLDDAGRTANGAGVVYAALRFDELAVDATDNITFYVTGTDDVKYVAQKTSPVGGFKNGKYYTSTIALSQAPAYLSATAEDKGKVIGADGNIYADAAAATAAGTTAEAMIAYVGNEFWLCIHGLAISLTDAYEYNTTFAQATGDYIIPTWAAAHPVPYGAWRLPSNKDWQLMMWGYFADYPEPSPVGAMKAAITDGYYWTSVPVGEDNARAVYYDGTTYASMQILAQTGSWHVRACLAF